MKKWRCVICGEILESENVPERCPRCKAGSDKFEEIVEAKATTPKKWKCEYCGEIVESENAPEKCPLCKASSDKFKEVVDAEMTWAAEHVIGVAKDAAVPAEIVEGLRANFQGECTEVGTIFCPSASVSVCIG